MSSACDDTMCERVEVYALDGLEEHEKVAFEYHLTQCALCRNLFIELKSVVDLLPMASDPVPVPSGMRGRVLRNVLGEKASQAGNIPEPMQSEGGRASRREVHKRKILLGKGAGDEANADELSRRTAQLERSARRAVIWRLASAGLAAAVIGAGLYVYQLKAAIDGLQIKLDAANQKVTQTESDLVKAKSDLIESKKPSEALKVNRIVSLSPAAENVLAKGTAAIVLDAKGTHLIVQAEDLPQIKQEESYQVWLIKDNQPVNAGTFYPLNGRGMIYYTFEPKEYDSVAVTLEPDAHGEKPRGSVVIAAGLNL